MRSIAGRSPADDGASRIREWHERNADRLFEPTPLTDLELDGILGRLREDGVAIARFEQLFGSPQLFDEALARARPVYDRHKETPEAKSYDEKSFLTSLLAGDFEADDPFVAIALHPNVLAVVNRYLGMRAMLRSVELWLTTPTAGPAVQTQLWHRDGDDVLNAKLFVYLTDVRRESGPFTYAPATHPVGSRLELPDRDEGGRSNDEQMAAIVPEDEWLVCTGDAATVVLADTCGYHKQLKPESEERLVLVIQYTSGTPNYPSSLGVRGADDAAQSEDQRAALRRS